MALYMHRQVKTETEYIINSNIQIVRSLNFWNKSDSVLQQYMTVHLKSVNCLFHYSSAQVVVIANRQIAQMYTTHALIHTNTHTKWNNDGHKHTDTYTSITLKRTVCTFENSFLKLRLLKQNPTRGLSVNNKWSFLLQCTSLTKVSRPCFTRSTKVNA